MGVGSILKMAHFQTDSLQKALQALLSSDTVPEQCRKLAFRFAPNANAETSSDMLCNGITGRRLARACLRLDVGVIWTSMGVQASRAGV